MKWPDVRSGPFCRPLASGPWQRTQLEAWKRESPNVTMAVVTPGGSAPAEGLVAAAGADDALGAGAGAGVVLVEELLDPPPHAAMATVATVRTGRTRELLVIRWMAEGMDGLRPTERTNGLQRCPRMT
jgi:hypothetical protein